MTDSERREQEDMTAFNLQKSMAAEVLLLVVEKPTVEYSIRKVAFQNRRYKHLPELGILDMYELEGWEEYNDINKLDVMVWKCFNSEYLPYLFGSLDGRTPALNSTAIGYDKATFVRGMNILQTKLDKIYKVIKFRNPNFVMPKPKKIVDWRDQCTTINQGSSRYYYRWDKKVYELRAKPTLPVSFAPSFHHINVIQKSQPSHYYSLLNEYEFIFFPGTKLMSECELCDNPVDVSPMLTGTALASGEIWPKSLKRVCFPMLAVETIDLPLFNWLASKHHQNNRNLKYYALRESMYYEFLAYNGGVNADETSTVIYLHNMYGPSYIDYAQTPGLVITEIKAKEEALENWEDYE